MVVVDAVILMGGRAERLGGIAKGDLRVEGRTLLERVVSAAGVARRRVVVGEVGAS
ncbi:molybdenum cofactor guanylyltransferase, partial [Agromyces binzhouensis]